MELFLIPTQINLKMFNKILIAKNIFYVRKFEFLYSNITPAFFIYSSAIFIL
jgi:phospholipid N-methyltransferase